MICVYICNIICAHLTQYDDIESSLVLPDSSMEVFRTGICTEVFRSYGTVLKAGSLVSLQNTQPVSSQKRCLTCRWGYPLVIVTYWYIENSHVSWIFSLKFVMFHGYVSLLEGNYWSEWCWLWCWYECHNHCSNLDHYTTLVWSGVNRAARQTFIMSGRSKSGQNCAFVEYEKPDQAGPWKRKIGKSDPAWPAEEWRTMARNTSYKYL